MSSIAAEFSTAECEHARLAFPTVFLPMTLPQNPVPGEANALMELFKTFIEKGPLSLSSGEPGAAAVKLRQEVCNFSRRFFDVHGDMLKEAQGDGNLNVQRVYENLVNKMAVGCSHAFFLRAQNAVCFIERTSSTEGFVVCWEVQATKGAVMGSCDGLALRIDVPRAAMKIKWELVQQFSFAEFLCDLANNEQEKAIPKATKAGHEFQETRDVANPMYAFDILWAYRGLATSRVS
jgi:hypothetical protein